MDKTFPVSDCLCTEDFIDFLISKPTGSADDYMKLLTDYVVAKSGLTAYATGIMTAVRGRWAFHEIAGPSEDKQLIYLETVIDTRASYYAEKFEAYTKVFDYAKATTLTIEKEGEINDSNTNGVTNTTHGTDETSVTGIKSGSVDTSETETDTNDLLETDIALPNKVTGNEYAAGKVKNTGTTGVVKGGHVESEGHDTTTGTDTKTGTSQTDVTGTAKRTDTDNKTITDNAKYLEAKEQYMKQIKNLYLEFAESLSDCFIHILA